MTTLKHLLSKLGIDEKYLIIVDDITGAGYIEKDDCVFCRWGHIHEGIALLDAYLEAYEHHFDIDYIPSRRGRPSQWTSH